MKKLTNFILGNEITGDGLGQELTNAVDGTPLAYASTKGLDFAAVLKYGREEGNTLLRKMSFHERGNMLKALALHLRSYLPAFYALSYQTGATKTDSWIDIEGGIGNLFANASLRRKLPDSSFAIDGETHLLGNEHHFAAKHLLIPKEGVAIHINAFNFPVWGMLEKIAVNLLAGVPAVVKPATVTSYLTHAVVAEIINSGILPKGALQLICGSAGDLLNHVTSQDVVTFTGSAETGLLLKGHDRIMRENVPFNMEADSLNAIVLGEDVEPEMPEFALFIKEVHREMTIKAGQKCTAIRRILVPENKMEMVQDALIERLQQTVIGSPLNERVRMGALAGQAQRMEVQERVTQLLTETALVYGSMEAIPLTDADYDKGAFLSPVLLLNNNPLKSTVVHETEAFGPVATLMPYKGLDEAIFLTKKGKGSLVSTIVTNNPKTARTYVIGAGTYHGRILVLNRDAAKESTGHGSPLPLLVHGGPGRAGGGEEMGGLRGIKHYMQRVAVQGSPDMLTAVSGVYQPYARGVVSTVHPFKKYYEELQPGDQLITAKRIITAEDINRFADLSGDHFYAHLTTTDFANTMFDGQVAHGYLLMSLAAGLFVDSYEKNPVLLNYGIDELRFTKPVYPGHELYIRFTCKEKLPVDKKEPEDIAKGIVKWYVEILDETEEPVIGVATILTMVARK